MTQLKTLVTHGVKGFLFATAYEGKRVYFDSV